jgi:hypothetical protein
MLSFSPQEDDCQGITDERKYDSMKGKVTVMFLIKGH